MLDYAGLILINPAALDRAYVAKHGLHGFVRVAWEHIDKNPFQDNWHLQEYCSHLQAAARYSPERPRPDAIQNLLVNLPPGTSKSKVGSVLYSVWDWIDTPHPITGALGWRRTLLAAWEKGLMIDANNLCRTLIRSEWFRRRWGDLSDHKHPIIMLREKRDRGAEIIASEKGSQFEIYGGGMRSVTSPGANVIGRHFHTHIIDDPTKAIDAEGTIADLGANLEAVRTWYQNTLPTRRIPGWDQTIHIAQRLHTHDLSGLILEEEKKQAPEHRTWVHLNLPGQYDPTPEPDLNLPCVTPFGGDRRTEKGEPLTSTMTPDWFRAMMARMGVYFNAQVNQRPHPEGGTIIARDWTNNRWHSKPRGGIWVQSWDCAFKDKDDSSYVCGQLWCMMQAQFYLIDQVKEKLTLPGTIAKIRGLRKSHYWSQATVLLVEDKANGPGVVQTLTAEVPGMIPYSPGNDSKEGRLRACSGFFQAGNVFLPAEAPWLEMYPDGSAGYITEITSFPQSRHSDQVDSTTQAILWWHAESGSDWLSLWGKKE